MIPISTHQGLTSFAVRVIPRAGRSALAGVRNDALVVRLAAPPVDGAANEALVAFLARLFDRPARDVTIAAGHRSRHKRVAVSGVTADQLAAMLSAILPA